IPGGRIDRGSVLGFGLTLSIVSVAMMALMVNWLSAGLLAFTIFFYVVVYTMWLKRLTPQNIVIGGASGALPPVVAWAAVTNSVSIESLVLFAIIFIWTPPHFWSLSLFCSDDYERAGVPMLPVVAGEKETRNQIFIYSMLLAPLGVLPWAMGFAGSVYAIVSMTFGAVFMYLATRVWKDDGEEGEARKLFAFSIMYLFVLFAVIAGEALFEGLL
ncbi:MAG: heme o synthase, partial [Sphingomonadales bacterium]|nr:heme o synthase [Sphingomonadales bacterium]